MEHSIGTPPSSTQTAPPTTRPDSPVESPTARPQARVEREAWSERQARADWLITELGRLAAQAEDPHERVRLRRTADSLIRLATAYRS